MSFNLPDLIKMFNSGMEVQAHRRIRNHLKKVTKVYDDSDFWQHYRMIELDAFNNYEYWNNVGYMCAHVHDFLNASYAYYESLSFGDSDKGRAYLGLALSLHQMERFGEVKTICLKGLQHAIDAYTNEMFHDEEVIIAQADELVDVLMVPPVIAGDGAGDRSVEFPLDNLFDEDAKKIMDVVDDESVEPMSDEEMDEMTKHLDGEFDGGYFDEFDTKPDSTEMLQGFFAVNKKDDRDYLIGVLNNLMFMYRRALFDEEDQERMVTPIWDTKNI